MNHLEQYKFEGLSYQHLPFTEISHHQHPLGIWNPVFVKVKLPQVSLSCAFARVASKVYATAVGPEEKPMLYLIAPPVAPMG